MPRRSKASNAARAKRKESNNLFTHASPEISDGGSVYNDSGDDSPVSDTANETDSDDENASQALESLQKLYTVFLHPNKRKQMQKMMVNIECHAKYMHLLTENSQTKSRKLSRSEARKGLTYTGCSRT